MSDTFYREQKAPTDQRTYNPGDDYTEDLGLPSGNPGFGRLPERDDMNPSSGKVTPDSMKQTLQENYSPRAARVAAPFIASLVCNPLATSTAWVDPKGKVYEIPRGKTHDQWAESYLTKDRAFQDSGQTGWTWLIDQGWVRFVNFLNIEVGPNGASFPAMEAAAKMVVDCALSRRDVEPEDRISLGWGIRTKRPTIGDFVAEWGSRKMEERLYEGLLSRGQGSKTEALAEDIVSRWAFELEPTGPAKRIVEGLQDLDSWVRGEGPFPGNKTAATIGDILGNTGPEVMKRAKKVALSPRRFSPDKGFWIFTATGSSGDKYTVRIKGVRKGNIVDLSKAQIKCSCSCPFWRWQGPEHWAHKNGYLYRSTKVKPQGTMSTPVVRDPQGKHWVCKHMAAALDKARSYRFASSNDWTFEGEVVVAPSPERVVQAFLARVRVQ